LYLRRVSVRRSVLIVITFSLNRVAYRIDKSSQRLNHDFEPPRRTRQKQGFIDYDDKLCSDNTEAVSDTVDVLSCIRSSFNTCVTTQSRGEKN
jgi:hypothetical protein